MNETVTVFFNSRGRSWEVIRRVLEAANARELIQRGPALMDIYHLAVPRDSSELEAVRTILRREGIEWFERHEKHYSVPELRRFPLLWMTVRTEPRGVGGPSGGTQYDLSRACPRCGTGAEQTSELYLDPLETPLRSALFQTMSFEFLVAPLVAEGLRAASITGLEVRQARSSVDHDLLPWWQLIAAYEIPSMAPESSGILREKPCPHCNRDGYFHDNHAPVELKYRSCDVDLAALPDCVQTYEYFGKSLLRNPPQSSVFASPLLLVKPRVFNVLRGLKVRSARYGPVQFLAS